MVSIVGKRYQIEAEIGSGGMGTVYRGIDMQSQQPVAIKRLHDSKAQPEIIERFKREGDALRELNHPNIVKMLDTFEHEDGHYLVMEHVAGGDLNALLRQGQLSIEHCLRLALDLADALTRAHKLDIIHRDLKPANVLLADDGTLRLTDFGVAHLGQRERVTHTDAIIGTADYLAPEVLEGATADSQADIWSFGVMLFEMIIGKRPFQGETVIHTLHAITTQPVPNLEKLRPDAPVALIDLIYRMLEKDYHARIRSVRQVGLELENILYRRSTHMPPETRFAPDTPTLILRPKHNLPVQATPFVGREAELSELAKLLIDPKIRLITIVAQGGMGKTRLALEFAVNYVAGQKSPLPVYGEEAGSQGFKGGVYFVELAPISDPVNIVSTIAEATNYQFQSDGREQKQQVLDFLGNKNLLLVMDNYEHLLDGASLVTEILKAAPDVKILATSRQRLNQSSETIFNLEGMDFPAWETPADALEYAAVKLFMQSAKRAQPNFELTVDNMDAVARICKLIQGMPLGIVMAAAWLAALSPDEIAAEIAQSIDFLASTLDDIPERQRSMRAVFDYSWNLMNDAEQQVFMKLAVFRGGFTRKAGQAVTGANLQDLMSLVSKSLLRRDNDSGRYEIHELLRQYAAEKAEHSGQSETIADTHMTYYANAMHERESHLNSHRQLEALNDITSDFENVRAAWIWAVDHEHFEVVDQMLESLRHYCGLSTRFEVGITLLSMAVQRYLNIKKVIYPAIYGRLLSRLSLLYSWSGQAAQGHKLAETGLHIAREQGERHEIAMALLSLSFAVQPLGQPQQAWTLAEESRTLFHKTEDKAHEGLALTMLGYLAANQGQYEQSEQLWLAGLRTHRDIGNKAGIANLTMNLGVVEATWHRRFDRAEALYRESLTLRRELRLLEGVRFTLANLGALYAEQGKYDEAEKAASEALLVAQESNFRPGIIRGLIGVAYAKSLRGDYESALKFADEAQALVQPTDDLFIGGEVKLARGMVLCHKGDFAAAENSLDTVLHELASGAEVFRLVECVFGFSVVLAFHHQEDERALAIASMLAHHPLTSWLDTDPLAKRLLAHLQQQLPADVYAAAWEQGKSLDFDAVVKELLAEFGDKRDD